MVLRWLHVGPDEALLPLRRDRLHVLADLRADEWHEPLGLESKFAGDWDIGPDVTRFHYNPDFYFFKHLSHFVQPGADCSRPRARTRTCSPSPIRIKARLCFCETRPLTNESSMFLLPGRRSRWSCRRIRSARWSSNKLKTSVPFKVSSGLGVHARGTLLPGALIWMRGCPHFGHFWSRTSSA